MQRVRAHSLLAILVMANCGCGQSSDRWISARPQTTLASGTITFDGAPLEGAVVVFHPDSPDGIGASAVTDEAGKFELKTFPPECGVVPGEYSVTVMKSMMPGPSKTDGSSEDPSPIHVISVIPTDYGLPAKSGLAARVPDIGTDSLLFELRK